MNNDEALAQAGRTAGRRAVLARRIRFLVAATIAYIVADAIIAISAGRLLRPSP